MKIYNWLLLSLFALVTAQTKAQSFSNTLEVWMDEVHNVIADGTTVTKVTVYQKDPNFNYTTFNMTLTIPKGMSIHKVKSGRDYVNDIELSVRATNTHTIACNMPEDRTVRIICMSSELQDLYPDDEDGNEYYPLFTIGFVADPSTYNGKYQIELTGCRFVHNDGENLTPADLDHTEYSEFVVTGGTDFPGVDCTVPAEGIGTLILPFDSPIPAGMNVYECNGISDENSLVLDPVGEIAANTPYIITGREGNYHFDGTYRALKEMYSTEYMTGVFEQMPVPANAYVMQNHKNTLGLGFYRVGETEVTINPYKCYLNALPVQTTFFSIPWGEMTGVDMPGLGSAEVNVYNVEGKLIRKGVKQNRALDGLDAGVYIINNQKFIKE